MHGIGLDTMASPKEGWPHVGARARLCNLAKFPQFNGQTVELLRWDTEKQRWKCLLANGGDVNVRLENLEQPAPIAVAVATKRSSTAAEVPAETVALVKSLLKQGHVYEARQALSGQVGKPPTERAALAAWLDPGMYSECVGGRVELVDIPGRGKGYRATTTIRRGEVLLFDMAFCSDLVGPSSNADLARQCWQHKDREFLQLEVMSLQPGVTGEGQQKLVRALANNVFECTREPGHVALFVAAARFNHSCCPSAYVDSTRAECVVRALRDIPAGEEVCISYVPVSDSLAKRQEALNGRGFVCTCQRCEEETKADPQMLVPCTCGAASFSIQPGARSYQTCAECMATFEREEALHNLSKVVDINTFMQTPAATKEDPSKLVNRLSALEGVVMPGARNGVPPLHTASMFLLNNLANLQYHVAMRVPGPHASASLDVFYRCKKHAIEVFEAKHSMWTNQRDVDYFQLLQAMLACDTLKQEWKDLWKQKLADACVACFGQTDVPASFSAANRR